MFFVIAALESTTQIFYLDCYFDDPQKYLSLRLIDPFRRFFDLKTIHASYLLFNNFFKQLIHDPCVKYIIFPQILAGLNKI